MAIERILSKRHKTLLLSLVSRKNELQTQFRETVEAEQELVEMLRVHYRLPEGKYELRQEGQDVILFKAQEAQPPKEDKPPEPEPD